MCLVLPIGEQHQTLLANNISMDNRQEIFDLVDRQAKGWETGNVTQIVADFADDAVFVVNKTILQGKVEIERSAKNYVRQFTDTKVNLKQIIIEGNKGAIEWDWSDRNRQTQTISNAEDAIIFELRQHKIIYWREYIDKND